MLIAVSVGLCRLDILVLAPKSRRTRIRSGSLVISSGVWPSLVTMLGLHRPLFIRLVTMSTFVVSDIDQDLHIYVYRKKMLINDAGVGYTEQRGAWKHCVLQHLIVTMLFRGSQ